MNFLVHASLFLSDIPGNKTYLLQCNGDFQLFLILIFKASEPHFKTSLFRTSVYAMDNGGAAPVGRQKEGDSIPAEI